jgi:hypothetical protein
MDGATTHTLAAVVAAEFDRVIAASDALAKPIKLFLFVFVGREILQASVPPPAPVPTIAKSISSSSL